MDGAVIAQWVATFILAVGLVLTWRSNGRNREEIEKKRSERWGGMEKEIENIKKKLDDPNSGLGAIKKAVDDQRTHCASITSEFSQRIATLEKESGK